MRKSGRTDFSRHSFAKNIQSNIKSRFDNSRYVWQNPNVFYEVGYAHALDRPTILLTTNANDSFDLKHFPHIVYEGKISTIRDELIKRLEWFKKNTPGNTVQFKNEIDLYVSKENLASNEVSIFYTAGDLPYFDLTIHNVSATTYEVGDFQIAIITSTYSSCQTNGSTTTKLPNGDYLHVLPFFERLFPQAYTSIKVKLQTDSEIYRSSLYFDVVVRVFTNSGYRDFILKLLRRQRN